MFQYVTQRASVFNGVQLIVELPNGRRFSIISHDESYGGKSGEWEMLEITSINEDLDISDKYGRACAAVQDKAFHSGWMNGRDIQEQLEFFMTESHDQYMNDVA